MYERKNGVGKKKQEGERKNVGRGDGEEMEMQLEVEERILHVRSGGEVTSRQLCVSVLYVTRACMCRWNPKHIDHEALRMQDIFPIIGRWVGAEPQLGNPFVSVLGAKKC